MQAKQKKVTKAYIERAAIHYLGRYASTKARLQMVLEQKVMKRNANREAISEEQAGWISEVVRKCAEYRYVDDMAYAKSRSSALLAKGKAVFLIRQDLSHKGVAEEIIDSVLSELETTKGSDLSLMAAAAYVRKRRFGAFRRADMPSSSEDLYNKERKEQAAMMRAGFSYTVIEHVLKADEAELLDLLP